MKILSFIILLLYVQGAVIASAQSSHSLKERLVLKMTGEGGYNGAAVAWHAGLKKYYAVIAGNAAYPLSVFDAAGKQLSRDNQAALFDIRGLWYNTLTKTLQMNGYLENGWAEYKLNAAGLPQSSKELYKAMIQPNEHSSAAFNPKENVLYFFNRDGNVEKYSLKDGIYLDEIKLLLGTTEKNNEAAQFNDDMIKNYNSTTLVFTGVAGEEIGLLNHAEKQVELYSIATGLLIKKLMLPADAPVAAFLNFSYCNGLYWLFDKENRAWKGYR